MSKALSMRLSKLDPKEVPRFWTLWLDKDADIEAEKERLRQKGMKEEDELCLVHWLDLEDA